MKFFKKIWTTIKIFFVGKKKKSDIKVYQDAKATIEKSIDKEEILTKASNATNDEERKEILKPLIEFESAKQIVEVIEQEPEILSEQKTTKKRKKLYDLHELEIEIKLLQSSLSLLELKKASIKEVANPDTSSFDSRIDKLFSLLSKNIINDKVELSDFTVSAFDKDFKQLEKLLQEKSTLKRHGNREREKLKQREIYESNIKKELNNLDSLIGQNKLEDAKLLVNRLSKSIKPDFKKGVERLSKAVAKLKEKELENFKKRQAEVLRKQQEEVERIKILEEKTKEERRIQELIDRIEFEFNSEYENVLDNYKIDYVFHMTDVSNLKNILQYGLLSHNEAHSKGLNKTDIALQDVNQRRANKKPIHGISLHDYVPMYFNPKNPMLYRRKQIQNNIVILAIDRRVIYQNKSIFSDGNAASDATKFFNNLSDLVRLNWQCIRNEYWNDYVDGKRIKCAETLTYPKIPIKYLKKIHCNSIQTKNIVDKMVSIERPFRVELNSKYFFR
jgi:hypothetical protein